MLSLEGIDDVVYVTMLAPKHLNTLVVDMAQMVLVPMASTSAQVREVNCESDTAVGGIRRVDGD